MLRWSVMTGKLRVGGNKGSVGVSEGYALRAGQIGDGRDGADIESAHIIFAAEVGAFKWGRDDSVKSRDERTPEGCNRGRCGAFAWGKTVCTERSAGWCERCRPGRRTLRQ